ncbi:Leucine rich repeat/RNI-like superfamily protein [Klebsormidium nitens]|uniref:Leucine rich repeat/RNI-like superfamily protein n=1 Tax=Klebsormidium nitens TaxID=105231 RepID=A0A1Y1HVF2_KLENI|nr:Leucine rich repeat/RNI-like superfamily protein [Klebsormidium nitens]|eukprot:GAQ82143.1 Leucine rich repeat/RNI-like superfamily protein [Klebsormidium nitens]
MDIEDGFESVRDVFGSTDLLAHILHFLDEPVDKDAACRVNKSWLHAFQSVPQRLAFRRVEDAQQPRWRDSIVVSLAIMLGRDSLTEEALKLASQQFPQSLQRLTLWSALPSGASCQLGLIAQCRNLVTLSLHQVIVAEPVDLGPVFQACKQLEKVCITYEAFPTNPWFQRDGRGFRDDQSGLVWQVLTDNDIEDLVVNCPRLRHLELQDCRAVGDSGVSALQKATNLRTLSLVGAFQFSFPGLASVGECLSLEEVTLDLRPPKPEPGTNMGRARLVNTRFDVTQTLNKLVGCPRLKRLRLGRFVRSRGLPSIWFSLEVLEAHLELLSSNVGSLRALAGHCRTLRVFKIQSDSQGAPSDSEGAEVLKRIGWACPPNLEKVSVQCNKVDPSAVEALSNCPNLASLEIASTAITSKGIAYLAARTRRITELSLASSQPVRGVSDEGVQAIAQAAPSLRRLNLTRCTSLSDIGFASLATCSKLETLNLSYTAIGDVGLVALIKSLPGLTEIILESCHNITNLTPLAWLGSLEILGLQRCENAVTDDLIEELVLECRKLRTLYLDGCKRLTEGVYVSLAESRSISVLTLRDCEAVETALMVLATNSIGWLTKVTVSPTVPSCQGAQLLRERGVLDVRS